MERELAGVGLGVGAGVGVGVGVGVGPEPLVPLLPPRQPVSISAPRIAQGNTCVLILESLPG